MNKLTNLDITSTFVNDVGFSSLKYVTKMKSLSLINCRISYHGLNNITLLTSLEELYVTFFNVRISNQALLLICQLNSLRTLHIMVNDDFNLSPDVIDKLVSLSEFSMFDREVRAVVGVNRGFAHVLLLRKLLKR